jgi:mono/diheme cytochrome c family protein
MTSGKMFSIAALIAAATVGAALSAPWTALAQSATTPDPTDAGKAVFKRANCFGCRKWHGNGGGGYGGDALSLRKTELTREQIIETVGCGRPGKGMPFFTRGAYGTIKCDQMNRQDAGGHMPPEANTFLRPNDIEAVADYVMVHIEGNGEPNYTECVSFFGDTSRVCDSRPQIPLQAQERCNNVSSVAIARDVRFHLVAAGHGGGDDAGRGPGRRRQRPPRHPAREAGDGLA